MKKEELQRGSDTTSVDLQSIIDGLTDEEKEELFDLLAQDINRRNINNSSSSEFDVNQLGNHYRNAIEYFKKNCVTIEDNVKMHDLLGRNVIIDLPVIGEHEGIRFKYFMSYNSIGIDCFDERLEQLSYSEEEISNLIRAIDSYFKDLYPADNPPGYLINSLLNHSPHFGVFWLKNTKDDGKKNARLRRHSPMGSMQYFRSGEDYTGHYLLKIK